MKQKLENYIFEQLKAHIDEDLKSMLITGHSNDKRQTPYIYVDVSDFKPLEGMSWSDDIFTVELTIAIADSAHDIDYKIQATRRRAVELAMHNIKSSDEFLINFLDLIEMPDARDDNNIGDVLKYEIIVQCL